MVFKQIAKQDLDEIIVRTGFDYDLLTKDYYITVLLYHLKEIKGIYFKGGTALQLTLLDHSRISEDIDFTIDRPLAVVRKEIEAVINNTKLFGVITQDKDVDGFVRLVVPYTSSMGESMVFIDINERAKLVLEPQDILLKHFYPNMDQFRFPCLNIRELVAEKIAAAIGRNKPRDHYDIYQLIKHGVEFDMGLVKKKCEQSGVEFDIVKMFNNAKKLHKRWDEDMVPLLAEEVDFKEVMQTLAEYFDLPSKR